MYQILSRVNDHVLSAWLNECRRINVSDLGVADFVLAALIVWEAARTSVVIKDC